MTTSRSLKVLLVDDDPLLLKLYVATVQRRFPHAMVASARDGEEALELFEFLQPDVMVTDHQMPRLTGAELVRTLRERGVRTPLVLCSGAFHPDDLPVTGATMTVAKPEMGDLGALVASLVSDTTSRLTA